MPFWRMIGLTTFTTSILFSIAGGSWISTAGIVCLAGFIILCVWLAKGEQEANIQRQKNEDEKWEDYKKTKTNPNLPYIVPKSQYTPSIRPLPDLASTEIAIDLRDFMRDNNGHNVMRVGFRSIDHDRLQRDIFEKARWIGIHGMDGDFHLDLNGEWVIYSLPCEDDAMLFKLTWGGISGK